MIVKPSYFISGTDAGDEVITTECIKAENGAWQTKRSKRSANLDAARKLIPAGYHLQAGSEKSTMLIEWWTPEATWPETLKGREP